MARTARVHYTADTHFDHEFVATLRGFDSSQAHDEEVISRWNAVVAPDDIVFHLGDLSLGLTPAAVDATRRLNGRITLVAGNHDRCWHRSGVSRHDPLRAISNVGAYLDAGIERVITSGAMLRNLPGTTQALILSHLPARLDGTDGPHATWSGVAPKWGSAAVICGHVHQAWDTYGININVGLDQRGLAPISEKAVARLVPKALKHATDVDNTDLITRGPWNALGLA